jgi:hypothetical protein
MKHDREGLSRRSFLATGAAVAAGAMLPSRLFGAARGDTFTEVPAQYIAALAEPNATSGNNAQTWGLWRQDPGPRGVALSQYDRLQLTKGKAPAGWRFDGKDWWLEEHGLLMESPEFPMPPGTYLVTGDRGKNATLTVSAPEKDGTQRWKLDGGASVCDVTHLRCRSARYTPASGAAPCSPTLAHEASFPVQPGAAMPPVDNCHKQDYSVLIVIGVKNGQTT